MKRGKPLSRKTPLRSNKGLGGGSGLKRTELKRCDSQLQRGELKKRSDKRAKFMKEDRAPTVRALIEAGVTCEVSPVFDEFGIEHHCTRQISGLHERRKRSAAGSLTNPANLVPSCSACNGQIEDQAGPVRERTGDILIVREGDPEWHQLGARSDEPQP